MTVLTRLRSWFARRSRRPAAALVPSRPLLEILEDRLAPATLLGDRWLAVVEPDRMMNEAMELARKIATKPKRTLKIGKEAFYRQLDMTIEDAYRYTVSVMVENMLDRDAEEGIGAFLDKREPDWPR